MVKDLTNFLKNGDITAKERALLLVKNYIEFDKTGKEPLSKADKHALVEGWRPKDNYEAEEYNRYYEGWRMFNFAQMDAQIARLRGENSFLTYMRMVDKIETIIESLEWDKSENTFNNLAFKRATNGLDVIDGLPYIKQSPLDFMIEHSGLEYDYTIYSYAYNTLSESDKKKMLDLYGDIETDSGFLTQEESVADALDKGKLTESGKKKLAELIADEPYNAYSKEYQLTDYAYFANIPVLSIAKGWAEVNGIDYKATPKQVADLKANKPQYKIVFEYALEVKDDDEKEKTISDYIDQENLLKALDKYADEHKTTVRDIIRDHTLECLDAGLLDEHKPLVVCETELWGNWIKAKQDAKTEVDKRIEKGELVVKELTENHKGKDREVYRTVTVKTITGKSLYAIKDKFNPADEYKEQIEHYKFLGGLILFLKASPFLKDYGELVGFVDTFKRLSKVYEVDLSVKTKGWVADFEANIKELNNSLIKIKEGIDHISYGLHRPNFFISFDYDYFYENYLVDLDKAEPNKPTKDYYDGEFKRILGAEYRK
jgi:hypothetical protein